jgi:5-hydroxyisourate hydrolase
MSPITTHVLDTARGRPASGIAVVLERNENGAWKDLGSGTTNTDGRITNLLAEGSLQSGTYRLTFSTGAYLGDQAFFPQVTIAFEVRDPAQHYHVPLLLSPFGYSTYRGS